jgi:hypothetical protein
LITECISLKGKNFISVINFFLENYTDLRLSHSSVSQTTYTSSLYGTQPQANRISTISYQSGMPNIYYDVMSQQHQQQQTSQQQQQSHNLENHHSPKVECPSPPCTTRSPVLVSADHSPDHQISSSPHIVTLTNSSPGPAGKLLIDTIERPSVVSIPS